MGLYNFPSSQPDFHPGYLSGHYYLACTSGESLTSFPLSASTLYYFPFFIAKNVTLTRLGANFTGTGVAGSLHRIGIYSNGSNNLPSTLMVDGGNIDTSTSGLKEVVISKALSPGWYWMAIMTNNPVSLSCFTAISSQIYLGKNTFDAAGCGALRQGSVTYGTLPSSAPVSSLSYTSVTPAIWIRA
jgi:hypothetical protein